mmetsp:Transcript_94213/g.255796  ORF Transcript_94213/g.255796 Transcript_94213/m.255796 type:complete len:241 (-) Transcript_94213:32-754(-)
MQRLRAPVSYYQAVPRVSDRAGGGHVPGVAMGTTPIIVLVNVLPLALHAGGPLRAQRVQGVVDLAYRHGLPDADLCERALPQGYPDDLEYAPQVALLPVVLPLRAARLHGLAAGPRARALGGHRGEAAAAGGLVEAALRRPRQLRRGRGDVGLRPALRCDCKRRHLLVLEDRSAGADRRERRRRLRQGRQPYSVRPVPARPVPGQHVHVTGCMDGEWGILLKTISARQKVSTINAHGESP